MLKYMAVGIMLLCAAPAMADDALSMMMRANARLERAFKDDYQDRVVPMLRKYVTRRENLEGRQRAGILTEAEGVELGLLLTMDGARLMTRRDVVRFLDTTSEGQCIKIYLKDTAPAANASIELYFPDREKL